MKKNIIKTGMVALAFSTSLVAGFASAEGTNSPLFDYVPQDSVFFLGNTKAISFENYMKSIDPRMLDVGDDKALKEMFKDESNKRSLFLKALWSDYIEVIKDPSKVVAHYGFKDEAEIAFYTNDMVPVARFAVSDSEAFMKVLADAEEESGFTAEEKTIDGQKYKSYLMSDGDDIPVELLVAVSDEWLTVAFAPSKTSDDELREIFGLKKVENNLNQTTKLADMIAEYGFDGYSLGYINHQEIAKIATSKTAPIFMNQADWDRNDSLHNEMCAADLAKITKTWPQTVYGSTKTSYTDTGMENEIRTVFEINNPEITTTLASLNGHLPPHLDATGQMFSLGLGLDVNNFTPAVTKLWQMATSTEYSCEPLVRAQKDLKQSNPAMVSMFAGMANGLKGLSLSVNSMDMDFEGSNPKVKSIDMLFSAASTNPSMIFSVLSMVNPNLRGIQVPADGSELKLNDKAPALNELNGDVFATIKGDHLNAYIGEKSKMISDATTDKKIASNGFLEFFMEYGPVFKLMNKQLTAEGEEVPAQLKAYENIDMVAGNVTLFSDKGIENLTHIKLTK